MALLSPLFLLGALAAAVPVVLHLLKRHPEAVIKFSAVRMLKDAPVEHASRRHLRELLLLALRIAALVFFALAFARPYFTASSAEGGPALIVALDTSFSMSGGDRFARAQALATEAIDGASSGTAIAVVGFDDTAQLLSALSTDRALARAAVAAARPGAGATRYRSAVMTASELLAQRTGGLVLVTDLQATGWDPQDRTSWPSSRELRVADVGASTSNLAVSSARAAGDRVIAAVRNISTRDVTAILHLEAASAAGAAPSAAGELRVPIAAGQSAQVVFPRPSGRWAVVRVADDEGPQADNERFLLLDGSARPRVAIVTTTGEVNHDAFYLEQALSASGQDDAASYEVAGVAGSALQSWDDARMSESAAVILLSTRGLDHRGRERLVKYLQGGGGLLIAATADIDADTVNELLGAGRITMIPAEGSRAPATSPITLAPGDSRHPVLRSFSGNATLGLALFRRVTDMRVDRCATLARFTTGQPALADCEAGRGRVLVFAADLDNRNNDLPLHSTFLPFVHEAVRYLASDRRASDVVVGHTPAGVPSRPGVAPLSPDNPNGSLVAVNVDPSESDPARMTPQEFQGAIARVDDAPAVRPERLATEREAQQHLWQYLLAAMLVLLLAESMVSMRTA